jgi:hypothetical protein
MKRVHPLRGLLVAAAMITMVGSSAFAQGKLEVVGGDTYDWGSVAPSRLKTVIQVKNVGSDSLIISNVRPSCGCTTAPIDKNVLMPGDIGKISVEIDMTNRTGPTTKTITVSSNDLKNPSQVIYLKADVKRAMMFTPAEYFLLTNAKVGEEIASMVRITNSGTEEFTLFPPEFVQGNVRVRFDMKEKKTLKPSEELEVKTYITPLEAGSANGTIRMTSTSNDYKTFDLPIYGTVEAKPAQTQSAQSK